MQEDRSSKKPTLSQTVASAGGLLLIILLAVFVVWSSQTYQDGGAVSKLHWEHHTYKERWQTVTREDWQKDISTRSAVMPVNGTGEVAGASNVRDCSQKFHHTDRVYQGQTCTGSGNKRHCRSDYKHVRVTKSWCTYDTWEWAVVQDVPLSGDSTETSWGVVAPGALDRERRAGIYDVHIAYVESGSPYAYVKHPKTEADFKSWRVGEKVMVEVYNLGFVRDIIRIEQIRVERGPS